ncbi:MAG: Glycosidase-related protein [Candidatus Gottesmanbacteria bacterium GW2011_GWA2_43_14]|uniref:Glycosidase-related protein n=1 Tax=Candidatus Gottesmanbacteria bacterium GW2011_GWA2_43_14 TaxID=1618443 RepID=A0A0G1FLE0_9BACT|nr:MAG: Glycosidase-related protein [Candidatus Gottesmanbacteria bacterium GW2011_GWA2_43_14]
MINVQRFEDNPVLSPIKAYPWESAAVFNGSVVVSDSHYYLVYRAVGLKQPYANTAIALSTIGLASSGNGKHFEKRHQFIVPSENFDRFGCEDPRITKFEGKYYIFYTALSAYPFTPDGIKVAAAVTGDLSKIEEKHRVTTFNSKAFGLFPERVNGKITAILTADTDRPPAKIAIAQFDKIEDIWSAEYWNNFYRSINAATINLVRSGHDHVEVGAVPVKTKEGWLLIYSYIYNYFIGHPTFAIEAVLLKGDDPKQVIARSAESLLVPEKHYELYGVVPNIVFPSGAIIENDELVIYYGAADTTVCRASVPLNVLLKSLLPQSAGVPVFKTKDIIPKERYRGNPIISPKKENIWENRFTFNPAAIYLEGKVHLLYRAMGQDDVSVLGYAVLGDGYNIAERLEEPVYTPREDFEKKKGGNAGCEDPRIIAVNDRIFMCYTAYNGIDNPRVALTSISIPDFINKKWNWEKPVLISPPNIDDKDAIMFPEKINGKYVFLHRFSPNIWIDYYSELEFGEDNYLNGEILMEPRVYSWDSEKIGIGPPPIKTRAGWLLVYHGISRYSKKYRLGAALLQTDNPSVVLSRLDYPVMEPESEHEKRGFRPDTVFSNGAVVIGDKLFLYTGAGDQVVDVVTMPLEKLLAELKKYHI